MMGRMVFCADAETRGKYHSQIPWQNRPTWFKTQTPFLTPNLDWQRTGKLGLFKGRFSFGVIVPLISGILRSLGETIRLECWTPKFTTFRPQHLLAKRLGSGQWWNFNLNSVGHYGADEEACSDSCGLVGYTSKRDLSTPSLLSSALVDGGVGFCLKGLFHFCLKEADIADCSLQYAIFLFTLKKYVMDGFSMVFT